MTAKKVQKNEKLAKEVKPNVLDGEMAKSQLVIGQVPKETFSLHVRGPKWIKDRDDSESKLKELNARIIKVRHPRQKSADYVFVDFVSAEDRDEAYKELLPLKDVHVLPARKDNPELVELRKSKVQAKREAKKQMADVMKNIAKNEQREKEPEKRKKLSNQIVILNLPKVTTQIELNEHFENVIDSKLNLDKNPKQNYSKAILTLATPKEAFNATRKVITLHDVKLRIRMHQNLNEIQKSKRQAKTKAKAKKRKSIESVKDGTDSTFDEPAAKRPLVLAPEKLNAGKKTKKMKKKTAKVANEVKKPLVKTTKSKPKKVTPTKKAVTPSE